MKMLIFVGQLQVVHHLLLPRHELSSTNYCYGNDGLTSSYLEANNCRVTVVLVASFFFFLASGIVEVGLLWLLQVCNHSLEDV